MPSKRDQKKALLLQRIEAQRTLMRLETRIVRTELSSRFSRATGLFRIGKDSAKAVRSKPSLFSIVFTLLGGQAKKWKTYLKVGSAVPVAITIGKWLWKRHKKKKQRQQAD